MTEALLTVENLKTYFHLRSGLLKAVDDVSFSLAPGRVLGIVGESGSGKSMTALSIIGLVDPPGRIEGGRIAYRGRNLLEMPERELEATIRGNRVGMIFQDPMTSLNPSFIIGEQIAEGLIAHKELGREAARANTVELLRLVGIPNAADRYYDYPHHFSGGMRQRVLIAAAIACEPDLLIADEPTTALDVTIQAQILKLLSDLRRRLGSAMILITHDLGVIAAMADDVIVMYAGRIVEYADVATLFRTPRHPYTVGLLNSIVRLEDSRDSALRSIPGAPPTPIDLPSGCSFRTRCPHAVERCAVEYPALRDAAPQHGVACHLVAPGEALNS